MRCWFCFVSVLRRGLREQRVLSALRRVEWCFIYLRAKSSRTIVYNVVSQRVERVTPKGEFRRYFMLACCFPCVNTTGPPTFGAHPRCSQPQQKLIMKARRAPRGDPLGLLWRIQSKSQSRSQIKALNRLQISCPRTSRHRHLLHRQQMRPEVARTRT